MIVTMYFFAIVMCFVCMLFNNRSKVVASIATIIVFIIFAGNNLNSDYNLYLFSWTTGDYDRYELGYKLYYDFLKKIGIKDYQTTIIITFLIIGIVVYLAMKKITQNYCTVLFLLLISELFIETVQIRTMIAAVFIFIAIYFYSTGAKKTAVLFAIISSLFQMTGGFFIPFFVIGLLKKDYLQIKERSKYQFIIAFVSVYFVLLLCNNVLHVNLPLLLIETIGNKFSIFKQASFYFGGTSWGSLQFIILYFANLFTVWYMKRNSRQLNTYGQVIEDINIYASFSLPFLFVDMNFYRFFRILNLANFVFCASVMESGKKNCVTTKKCRLLGVLFISQIVWLISYLLRVPEIYTDIFSNNIWR